MNLRFLLLGVIFILVIYFVYTYYFASDIVADRINLNEAAVTKNLNEMTRPGATRFSLSMWVHINELKSSETPIFSIEDSSAKSLEVLINSAAELKYKLGVNNDHTIMSNYPLQRWVNVILSFDNNVVDAYIDGKLIRSKSHTTSPNIGTNTSVIKFGTGVNGNIALFERTLEPMDPVTAWNKYMAGNGGIFGGFGETGMYFSNYGARFVITKDEEDLHNLHMF